MKKLKARIIELEKEVSQDEGREMDAEARARSRTLLRVMGSAASQIEGGGGAGGDDDEEDEIAQAARALLMDDAEMSTVHSTKSVATMLRAARDRATADTQMNPKNKSAPRAEFNGTTIPSHAASEPLVVTHDPSEGARINGGYKNSTSNLPYMHRNPAI